MLKSLTSLKWLCWECRDRLKSLCLVLLCATRELVANPEDLDLAEAASLFIEAAVGRSCFLDLDVFVLVLLLYDVFNKDEAPPVVVTPPRLESLQ